MQTATQKLSPTISGKRYKFVVVSDTPLGETQAKALQNQDYPIAGYGFYCFRCTEVVPGTFQSTWYCDGSSD